MSLFKTAIPLDLEAIRKLLPKDHSIEAVRFDGANNQVEVFWHCGSLNTPFTYATDFPVEDLKAKKLPAKTEFVERNRPPVQSAPQPKSDFEARAKAASAKARKKTVDTCSHIGG